MKKLIAVILSVMIILPTVFALNLGSYATEAVNGSSSATAPEDYVPQAGDYLFTQSNEDAKVLLIQDNLPWDSYANETVLNELGIAYDKVTTSQMSEIDLWEYKMAIIANDQTFATYENFKEFNENLHLFVNLGGVIIFGACDSGWADGTISWDLPGGLKKEFELSYNNYIDDYDHPIVTAELSDGIPLEDKNLYNNYCSHNVFDEATLPKNSNVIFRSSDSGRPTLVEYPLGSGYVIASTLTWEHEYRLANYGGYFGQKALDDLFLYGLSLCGELENGTKMKLFHDNNSFIHWADSFFAKKGKYTESQKYLIDDDIFNVLNSFYDEGDFTWESLPITKNIIQKQRNSDWGGSCYGISVTMALAHTEDIDLNNFSAADVNEYYQLAAPKNDPRVRSLINYYQLSQYLPIIDKKEVVVYGPGTTEYSNELKTIVNLAKQSEKSGTPFIFTFGYKWENGKDILGRQKWASAGHAIVCIGCTETNNGYKLEFLDPNSTSAYVYANVDMNYSAINFESIYNPSYQKSNNGRNNWQITRIGHDVLSIFSPIDIDGANNTGLIQTNAIDVQSVETAGYSDKPDVIIFNSKGTFRLIANDGRELYFNGSEITGDIEITSSEYYEEGDSVNYQISIEPNDSYTIIPTSDYIDISIYNGDMNFYAFSGTNAETITVNMYDSISATGDNMDYSVYCGFEGYENDMFSINNESADSIVVTNSYDDVVAEGDKLDEATLNVYNGENITNAVLEVNGETANIEKDGEFEEAVVVIDDMPNNISLIRNQSYTYFSEIDNENIYWSSSDESVISIDNDGNIAYGSTRTGSATIYAINPYTQEIIGQTQVNVSMTIWQWLITIFLLGFLWY